MPNLRSLLAVIAIALYLVTDTFSNRQWEKSKVIEWDVVFYYSYLPACFIHNDISLQFMNKDLVGFQRRHEFWPIATPTGGRAIKTTMGVALMYAPFFLLAHQYAGGDGFSDPYEFAICMAALFYVLIGLWYLRKLLLLHFDDIPATLTLAAVFLGTNLFYYSTTEAPMSHAFSFSLIAMFCYYSIRWKHEPLTKYIIACGVLLGLIVLIRPVNALIILFPFLYGIRSWKPLLLMGSIALLVFSPQMIYWKYIAGSFWFNGYVGERFYFSNIHLPEFLFSYRKGWLLYTPIMLFAVIGLYSLYRSKRELFAPVLSILLVFVIMYSAWWAWWAGGCFGARNLIDLYPVFALGMAAVFQQMAGHLKKFIFTAAIVMLLIVFNLFQTDQYRKGTIHYEGMTKEAYWTVFLKSELNAEELESYRSSLRPPDYEKAFRGEDEYDFNPF